MMGLTRRALTALLLCGTLLGSSSVLAQGMGPDATGPKTVEVGDKLAELKLPASFAWIGPKKTQELINKQGHASGNEVGAIVPTGDDSDFLVLLEYEKNGYVEDKDADKLDADEILKNYKEGTEAANEERKEKGGIPLHVTGWDEKPRYDSAKHVVVWSLLLQDDKKDNTVNYNTRILGRKGVLSVNLICDPKELPKAKPQLAKLLGAIDYKEGERYADYKKGDLIFAGGIAALVLGGLAKKAGILGFLFVLLKPLLVALKVGGAKVIAVGAAAVAAVGKKLFGKKDAPQG